MERIFALFDGNSDRSLTFPEFVKGITLLSPNGTVKEKTKCTFTGRGAVTGDVVGCYSRRWNSAGKSRRPMSDHSAVPRTA